MKSNMHQSNKHMKKPDVLLVLGSSNGSLSIVQTAKRMGVKTIVTDFLPRGKSMAKMLADEYWTINTGDVDELARECLKRGVTGVLAAASDFNVDKMIELNDRLGHASYCTADAWHYSRDKRMFKDLCKRVGAPIADDYGVTRTMLKGDRDAVKYPVVVKPIDLSSNRGVSYCYNEHDLINACRSAWEISDSDEIIVERMLHGEEWYGMYAIADGEARLLALNAMYSQPGEPKNCYTITTSVSNHVEQFIKEINPHITNVLSQAGCTDGMAWVQVMLDADGRFYIIEMGYRMDGEMTLIPCKDVCHFDSVKWMIEASLGRIHSREQLPTPQTKAFERCATSMDLFVNKGGTISEITGFDKMSEMEGVYVESNRHVGDAISKYSAVGIVTFVTENCDEMCEMIKKVNDTMHVYNEKGEDVIIKYTDFDYLKRVYAEGLAGK